MCQVVPDLDRPELWILARCRAAAALRSFVDQLVYPSSLDLFGTL